MIDAGIGTIRQLARADYSPRDLKALFITHNHLDHNGDLGNVISVGWMDGRTDPLLIYGPYGTEHMVAAALDYFSVPERIYMEQAIFSVPASSRSEEHTSELQSLMRISYAVFCLKKKSITKTCKKTAH